MYWADNIAERIINRRKNVIEKGETLTVASGITPSGHIHIGNAREVLTADAIYKSLKDKGIKARHVFVADTFDPLRKLYPFLPKEYEKYIGMPLSEIPCPEGCCNSYAEHFLKPFIESLDDLGIELELYKADEMYKKGLYNNRIIDSLNRKDEIREILNKFRDKPLPEDWYPLNVVCENCGKIKGKVIEWDGNKVKYRCEECGYENEVTPLNGRAKLSWRIDWPARWSFLNVVAEPMGKDHAAAGGSYDTGVLISRNIFNYIPPEKIVYEWIQLKIGDKAIPMSSSKGVVFAVKDWTHIAHPEILRFLILRTRPNKHIDFDLKTIPRLVDEYDKLEEKYFDKKCDQDEKRIYEMSTPKIPKKKRFVVPYSYCSIISQIVIKENDEIDINSLFDILKRNNYNIEDIDDESLKRLKERLIMARNWALKYGEKIVLLNKDESIQEYENLDNDQKNFVKVFFNKIKDIEFDALTLHNLVYDTAKELGLNPKDCFRSLYRVLLGKDYGPKLGAFLAIQGKERIFDVVNYLL